MRYDVQPGTMVFFAGNDWLGRAIALATSTPWQLLVQRRWISHVAIIADYEHDDGDLLLWESTSLGDAPCAIQGKVVRGVQAHDVGERISNYNGKVWVSHPRRRLTIPQRNALSESLINRLGTDYDYTQAGLAGLWLLRHWFWWVGVPNPEDDRNLFCSELVRLELEKIEVFGQANCSRYAPAKLAREPQDLGIYQPLIGVHG